MQACGGEFLSVVNSYSYGLMASMSITAVFEVFQILIEHYQYLSILEVFQKHNHISDISQKVLTSMHACMLCANLLHQLHRIER